MNDQVVGAPVVIAVECAMVFTSKVKKKKRAGRNFETKNALFCRFFNLQTTKSPEIDLFVAFFYVIPPKMKCASYKDDKKSLSTSSPSSLSRLPFF